MEQTIEKVFSITEEHCKSMIGGVCRQCGGELTPIETVDNGGNPTYWAHCPSCEIFCWGVDPSDYEIAKRLVDEKFYVAYRHMDLPDTIKEEWYADYYRKSQISGALYVVQNILEIQRKLNSEQSVQGSDTTEAQSSEEAKDIK